MILELCGGEASTVAQAGSAPDWRRTITFHPSRVASLGGVGVTPERQQEILGALGFAAEISGPAFVVTPPSWRADIEGEPDLVEEILRIEGYDRIPEIPLPRVAVVTKPAIDAAQRRVIWARRVLASRGLDEAVTWSFMDRKAADLFGNDGDTLDLLNPISADLSTMRPSILPNLIQAAARNAARGFADLGLFEVGPVFRPDGQATAAAGLRAGRSHPRHWSGAAGAVDAFDAKADLLALLSGLGVDTEKLAIAANAPAWFHPGRSGVARLGPTPLGAFGALHPDVLDALGLEGPCVGFEAALDVIPLRRRKGAALPPLKLSAFQPLRRDFAFVLPDAVSAERLLKAVRAADKTLIAAVRLFDLYVGPGVAPGSKSVAVEVTLQPVERTLTEAEIEQAAGRIVAAAAASVGAALRS
jgi:phenylalanyl-tRNA synthetase beta chain